MAGEQDPSVLRRGGALLWLTVRTHPRPFLVSVSGAALFSVAAVAGTIVLGRVTDEVLVPAFDPEGVDATSRWTAAAAIVGVAVLRSTGVVLRRYYGAKTQRAMQVSWFEALAERYVHEPLRFFLERPAGELVAHADADAERASFAMQPLPLSLGVVVIVAFATVSLAVVDPWLTLLALALFPALAVMNRLYTDRVERPAAAAQAAVGSVSAVAHESFEGALVVKTLGIEPVEQQRLEHEAERLRRERLEVGRLRAAFEPAIEALPNLGTLAVLAVGAWRVSVDAITTGEMVQAMALFGILVFPMRVVGFLLEELPRSVVAHDRLQSVLEDRSAHETTGSVPFPEHPPTLAFERLAFSYGDDPVLTDVAASIAAGEIVALVGATGSGKTTLCNLIGRLVEPTAGRVVLDGRDAADYQATSFRRHVAVVFQESFLFADTIRENVTLGRPVDDEAVRDALRIARADGFVDRLEHGLDQVVGERGITLSGGQRQRIALARALAGRPVVLVLDDATSAIDPEVEAEILTGLDTHLAATTVIVAHRLATIRLADRVLHLDGGRIVAAGTHDDLLEHPAYEALVRAYERGDA